MIVVAVAVFLVAIVGVGMALLYPAVESPRVESADIGARHINPTEYLRTLQTEPLIPEDLQTLPEVTFGLNNDEPATKPNNEPTPGAVAPTSATRETVPITRPEIVAPRKVVAPGTHAPAISTPTETHQTATVTPNRPQRTDLASVAAATARSTAPVPVTEYWIQLIASPSRDRVDQANVRLSDVNLSGRVTTRQIEGTLYYRLRVGPYSTQQEAKKFLEWIGELAGFENAYISEEYPLRS